MIIPLEPSPLFTPHEIPTVAILRSGYSPEEPLETRGVFLNFRAAMNHVHYGERQHPVTWETTDNGFRATSPTLHPISFTYEIEIVKVLS